MARLVPQPQKDKASLMRYWLISGITVTALAVMIACSGTGNSNKDRLHPAKAAAGDNEQECPVAAEMQGMPDDQVDVQSAQKNTYRFLEDKAQLAIIYEIIDENILPSIKRGLDILLNRKVSKKVLRTIAMKLRNSDPNTYDRFFIGYFLREMDLNEGYWATTHFDPNLVVQILGLTTEQEQVLIKKQPDDPSREAIGIWLDETPLAGNRVTIFRQDGKLFMGNYYANGRKKKKELIETPSGKNKKFQNKERNNFGEFYLINN